MDRGTRQARRDSIAVGADIRAARISGGLTLAAVGSAVGLSTSQVSRIERGMHPAVTVRQFSRIGAVVGLDIRVHAYPGPDPIRDAAQSALLGRFRDRIHPSLTFRTEVPLPIDGDQRAWDAMIIGLRPGVTAADDMARIRDRMPAEAETRIHDIQAQTRRVSLKLRDAGHAYVVLVVADTRTNRDAIRVARAAVTELFPIPARRALAALAAGVHPGGSALLFI